MKIEHLEYMIETYRRGSINGAAKNLFFSQSHLSAIIKGMEQEIGYPVFRRTREGVGLTEKGQIFIKSAEVIVKEHGKIMELSTQERHGAGHPGIRPARPARVPGSAHPGCKRQLPRYHTNF